MSAGANNVGHSRYRTSPVCPVARKSLGREFSNDVLNRPISINQVQHGSSLCFSVVNTLASAVKEIHY